MTECAEVLVRPAQPDDLADLIALEQNAFRDPWAPVSLREALSDARHVVLIAACNGVACGHVIVSIVGDEADLGRIAVGAAWHGRGLGRQLLVAALDECLRRGVHRLFLEVRVGNNPARKLYERAGFHEVGMRRRYYADGEDATVMEKILSAE